MQKQNKTVTVEPAHVAFTPFAMAGISEDLFCSAVSYTPEKRFPVANFFLFAASIEIGQKAAILSKDCSAANKEKIKKLGHDLDAVDRCFQEELDQILFAKEDLAVLSAVNVFYRDKGLEYFTAPMIVQAATAFKDFPKLEDFSKVARKVNEFIKDSKRFINSSTSEKAGKGFLNLY
jgi:hypothetical protein